MIFNLYGDRSRGPTSNRNIVITILHCDIVNVKRIHIHGATVVDYVVVHLTLDLFCFLNATVLHHDLPTSN